jgi:hypothetical protein
MKITKDAANSITLETAFFNITVYEELSQFINVHHWNWITFDFLKFEMDWERMTGCASITVVVLGIAFVLTFNYETEKSIKFWKDTNKMIEEITETDGKKLITTTSSEGVTYDWTENTDE